MDIVEGQTPAAALCFSKVGHFENKVESALVAKYEITLDECLAWTKAKSRPLCCAVNFILLHCSSAQATEFPCLTSGTLQCNQHKEIQSEYQRLFVLFTSSLFFFWAGLPHERSGFISSLWPRSITLLAAVQTRNQVKLVFPIYTQIWDDQ